MTDAILTINAGSSSIKFTLYEADEKATRIASGAVENIGEAPHFFADDAAGKRLTDRRWEAGARLTHETLLTPLLEWVEAHLGDATLIAAGHRIVHGGAKFTAPVRLDKNNLAALAALNPLAPLHQPHNLAPVYALAAMRPDLVQIGCFDTAFHHTMPSLARRLPLPKSFNDLGIQRYGFHGLSYEFISRQLRALAPKAAAGKVIAAHLGNGASLCGMIDGKSVDTTMGFTALDGLMMGTRTGSLDPGAVLYLMQTLKMRADEISHLLYEKSGLLGVSGITADMRVLLESKEPAAQEAIALFAYRVVREIGGLVALLDGLDCLVFSAGIGEHTPAVRAAICAKLSWLGIKIDDAANHENAPVISRPESGVEVRVIPTDEDATIVRQCRELAVKVQSR